MKVTEYIAKRDEIVYNYSGDIEEYINEGTPFAQLDELATEMIVGLMAEIRAKNERIECLESMIKNINVTETE